MNDKIEQYRKTRKHLNAIIENIRVAEVTRLINQERLNEMKRSVQGFETFNDDDNPLNW